MDNWGELHCSPRLRGPSFVHRHRRVHILNGLQAPVTTVLVTPDSLTLYLTSGESVACVGVVDGSEAWTAALDSDVVTVTLGAGPTPTLFVTSASGTVYACKG